MATNQNTSRGRTRTSQPRATTTTEAQKRQQNVSAYARQAAETAVDVPVGTAALVADRVGDTVKPFRSRIAAEREIRRIRGQFQRELNKAERRGGSVRRQVTQQVKRQRNRVEREVTQRRRRAETTLRQNRRKAETTLRRNRRQAEQQLRKARTRVEALV
jgi:hypothetical protein